MSATHTQDLPTLPTQLQSQCRGGKTKQRRYVRIMTSNMSPEIIFFRSTDLMVAFPYIVITFFVYSFVDELSSLHGKSVISYIFSVAIFHTSLAIVQLDESKLMSYHAICATAGYFIYSSIFVCFLWLIVMCFDVLLCFR